MCTTRHCGLFVYAGILVGSFVETLFLLLELITFQQFIVRWLLVIRARLALQAAREKREAARQQEHSSPAHEFVQDSEEPEIDIKVLSDDSLKLLNLTIMLLGALGIWGIWSEVLPAFRILLIELPCINTLSISPVKKATRRSPLVM